MMPPRPHENGEGFMRSWFYALGFAAAAAFAPRVASAQKEDIQSNHDGFVQNLLVFGGPGGGVQITCAKTGKDAAVESVAYYFNKRAELDEFIGVHNVAFDGIVVMPSLKKLDYYPLVEWIPFPDGVNKLLPALAVNTIWWDVEKNDNVRDAVMVFIKEGEKFCRNPRGLPTQFRPNSDEMFPPQNHKELGQAALLLRRSMPFFQE